MSKAQVRTRTVTLDSHQGQTTAFVAEPEGAGHFPAVVLGAEALGINDFIRDVAIDLAKAGFVAIAPDYFRGNGPRDPENYTDFSDVFAALEQLDFRRAAYDLLAAREWLTRQPHVKGNRISAWGYCTGGTMAWLAASLERHFASAVLFFPSQPVFEELTVKRPVSPIDLIWNLNCPVLLIYGDQDPLMPPERLAEIKKRFAQWHIPNEIIIYPGAGHSFTAHAPELYHAEASAKAAKDAMAFIDRHGR